MVGVHHVPHPGKPPVRAWALARAAAAVTWVDHTFVLPWDVAWYWGCVPFPEQAASMALASLAVLGLAVAPADPIDLFFLPFAPLWAPKRIAAWRANWRVGEEVIVIEEVEIRVYTCGEPWVGDLAGCALTAGCYVGYSDCPSRPAWSAPGA